MIHKVSWNSNDVTQRLMHNSTHSGVRTPQFVCSGVWFYVAFDLCQNRKLGRSSARKNLVKNLRPDKTSVNLLTSFRESYTTFGMKAAYGLQSSFHKMNLSRIIHGKLYQIWDESCICTCFWSSYLFLCLLQSRFHEMHNEERVLFLYVGVNDEERNILYSLNPH